MRIYITSIKDALSTRNWLAALGLALSLPDICGNCETPGKDNSRQRYQRWFEKWVGPKYVAKVQAKPPLPSAMLVAETPFNERAAMLQAYMEQMTAYMVQPVVPQVFLSGLDCYALRCAVTHQGSDQTDRQHAADALKRFSFVVSSPGMYQHNNRNGNVLQLDVPTFCNDICAAVEAWEMETAGDPAVEAEKSKLLTIFQF